MFPCYLICGLTARRVLTVREMMVSERLLLQNYIMPVFTSGTVFSRMQLTSIFFDE